MSEGGSATLDGDRVLADVNAVAISLLGDHPGHEYVFPHVRDAFEGKSTLLVFDYFPFRAQYVLTKHYGVAKHRARNVVQQFVRQPMELVSADREAILDSYELSAEYDHDVYDCFLVSLSRHHEVDAILTTDSDFEELCDGERFEYRNPVPEDVLVRFHERRS